MKEKNVLWRYFEASQSERNGFMIFGILILLLFGFYNIAHLFHTTKEVDFTKQIAMAEAYYAKLEKPVELFPFNPNTISRKDLRRLGLSYNVSDVVIRFRRLGGTFYKKSDFSLIYGLSKDKYSELEPYINFDKNKNKWKKRVSNITPFNFNPNTISKEKLLDLGLSEKIVKTILNFRNKKGKFYKPTDFLYIYGMTKEDFKVLEPYIQLKASAFYKPKKRKQYKKKDDYTKRDSSNTKSSYSKGKSYPTTPKEVVKVDINKSTPERWQLLYGIGPKLSKRITKFRDKLGGFHSIDQIATVYGLPDSTFQNIKSQLELSPIFKKLDINSEDINVLKSHPYLSWKKAKILLNYRENHGSFEGMDDLKKVGIFSEEELEKLGWYVEF